MYLYLLFHIFLCVRYEYMTLIVNYILNYDAYYTHKSK